MRRAGVIILALALAAWGAPRASAADEKPSPAHDAAIALMKQKLGPTFTVKRVGVLVVAWDLDADAGAQYEKFIVDVQDALYRDFFVNRPKGVFRVALFKDTASLQKNARKLAVKSAVMPMGGFYLPYERVICADVTGGGWIVQHEITHALLHADLGRENWPASTVTPWIDEGMASLIESAVLQDGAFVIRADWRLAMVGKLAKAGSLPKLRDVTKMDFATYNSPQKRMVCDAVARTFFYYLHEKGQLAPFYKAYRANLGADPSGAKFIEKAMQKTLEQIETDWLAWVAEKVDAPADTKAKAPPAPKE